MVDVSYGDDAPEVVNAVIEISRGMRNKYEMDKESGMLKLDRVNGTAMVYPADYGYIPNTLADDGDPLDVLLIIDEPIVPGVLVPSRVIGWMDMIDDGEPDQKIICVPADDVSKDHIQDINDISENWKLVVKHHFEHLKDFKKEFSNKGAVTINGFGGREEAYRLITECIERNKK